MADRKITDLTALAAGSQATGDLLTIVDVSEGAAADKNKKITMENLFKGIPGDVGIGTASPATALHVSGSGTQRIRITGTGSANAILTLDAPSSFTNYIEYGASASTPLAFYDVANTSERMRIDSSGRLLVGTTSDTTGDTGAKVQIVDTGTPVLALSRNDTSITSGNTIGQIRIFSNDDSGYQECARIAAQADGTFANNDKPTRLVFSTTADGAGSPTERMRIDSSGNVGIGTTTIEANTNYNTLEIAGDTSSGGAVVRLKTGDRSTAKTMLFCDTGGFEARVETNHPAVFSTNNTERMRIDSSGRLLVGTTSAPGSSIASTALIQVQGRAGFSSDYSVINARAGYTPSGADAALGFLTFCDSNNNIGAWITAYSDVGGWTSGSNHRSRLMFATTANGASSPTERMRILSEGYTHMSNNTSDSQYYENTLTHIVHQDTDNRVALVVENSGNSTPSGILIDFSDGAPDNNTAYFITGEDSSTVRFRVWSDGDLDNHDNSYGSTSDEKLKQDIIDAGSQWDDLKNLRVRKFKFKEDVAAYGDEAKTLIGLVAQEAETVCPGLVKDNPDLDADGNDLGTTTKSVRYSVLYMKAIKALQEAQTRIETLETQNTAQQAQIDDLLARVTALEAG